MGWVGAFAALALLAACTSAPTPVIPSVPRYVADPSTTGDFQGAESVALPAPSALDVPYLAGGLEGCPSGSDESCQGELFGTTYRGSHTFDLYEPPGAAGAPRPVIVWVHGGFSVAGDKSGLGGADYPADLLARQVQRGWTVVALNYRLNVPVPGPNGQVFPTEAVAAQDLDVAVRYLKAQAGELRLDPRRIVVWGHSWGAWAAMMQAVAAGQHAPAWLPAELAGHSPRVAAAVAEAGPSDLALTVPVALAEAQRQGELVDIDLSSLDPALLAALSPVGHVDRSDSPVYAIAGPQDPLIPIEDPEGMADRYEALQRPDLYRLDVVDDAAGAPVPWMWRTHVPHPAANRTELEHFLDAARG
jgi:acetyl esterase/lipase